MAIEKAIREKYEVIIGLEVHAQLLTNTKIYAPDSTEYGGLPNTNVSVITLAHPGAMPKLNKRVVEYAIKMGLAVGSDITRDNIFDRKNYFYPDLPKGYQITQDKTPLCTNGAIQFRMKDGSERKIGITKIHIEEDAGKSIHMDGDEDTIVDFNRAGVPLIEIVSEPDMRSSDEAYMYLQEIRRLVRYLDICDGNMEEGSLRCDANISVRLRGAEEFGKKVEVKNMNSFRNVQRAIDYEVNRQIEAIEKGGTIISETRNFDAVSGITIGMRTKEDLNDYRYFPEPDLSPMTVEQEWIDRIKSTMPLLPNELYKKFTGEYQLPEYDVNVLIDSRDVALYFEDLCSHTTNYKAASNWVMGPVKSYLNELALAVDQFPLNASTIAALIKLVDAGKLNFSVASQRLFPALIENPGKKADELAAELNLIQESDTASIQPVVEDVLASFPDKVEAYRKGKKGLIGMFMGEVMKRSKGKADPQVANELLRNILDKN